MAEDVIYGMMEDISYTNRLRYLIADLFEMAQDVADLDTDSDHRFNHVFEAHQSEIKKIKTRIMNFGSDEKNVGGEDEDEDELVVVGLEGDVHKLLDKVILKESCLYNPWYVKGIIGIGKTALARQVYNHKDVVSRFEHRGWVSFCSDMSYKEVLADNFPYIKYMALVNTCLDEDPMPIIEKLPCLQRLKLQNAYTGREMVISDRGFFRLEMLQMKELWNLRKIQVGEDAMWSLGQLNINCPHLETLPEELMKKLYKFKMVTTHCNKDQKFGVNLKYGGGGYHSITLS